MRSGWEKRAFEDIATIERGKFSARPRNDPKFFGGSIPFVQTGEVSRAKDCIREYSQTLNEQGLAVSRLFPKGTIMMGIAANVGDVAVLNFDAACPDSVVGITPKKNIDSDWLFQALKRMKHTFEGLSTQNAQKNLNLEKLQPVKIIVPPLPEQQKIAAILRTWDEAIEKLEKLKQRRKRLFNQWRRQLTNIKSGHGLKLHELSEIAEEINRRNDDYDAPVMMISSTQGFIRQDANYDREMAGESLKKYIHLQQGEFAYNKGNSKTYPYGCVFRLEVPEALIPFVYICFKLDDGLNANYFRHYFEAGSLNGQLIKLISSSVRGNGLLNIDSEDFFSCIIPVPDRAYQDKCAAFLDAASQELALLEAEITAIKNQKRGLMQKLLTGAWRVTPSKEVVA